MRVLLTGASGFIGRYVLDLLQQERIETVIVGRKFPPGCQGEFIQVDLLKLEDIPAVIYKARASHLLHLAWYAEHGQYWASPLNLRWVESTVRMIEEFCAAGGRHIVAAGTCAEYDWSTGFCQEDTTPLLPTTLYGAAKDATRRLAHAIANPAQVTFAWGRVFMPYGQQEDPRRLIPSLFAVFEERCDPFGVNANAYRDLLHVKDVANAFMHLLFAKAHGSYNIASGEPIRLSDLVALISRISNKNPNPVLDLDTARPGEPRVLFGDNKKMQDLGWRPSIDLYHGLTQVAGFSRVDQK